MSSIKLYKDKLKTKYRNVRSKCLSGHYHQSRGEAGHCNALLSDVQVKKIKSFECQKKYELRVNGFLICNHYVDFEIVHNDESISVDEYKGFETDLWRIKQRLFKVLYPDIFYKVIK